MCDNKTETWIIIGASRGIGLEFVKQLLEANQRVIAAVRSPSAATGLFDAINQAQTTDGRKGHCLVEKCDVSDSGSIDACMRRIQEITEKWNLGIANVVLNAGVNQYPNRVTQVSFGSFTHHLLTNTIGPLICAQKLLAVPNLRLEKLIFISSDSGSATRFQEHEDGFAVYAASKAALNQGVRHLVAEMGRLGSKKVSGKGKGTYILALHLGEVETDMSNIQLPWEVSGVIKPEESVRGMLKVVSEKGIEDSGSFWCWNGMVNPATSPRILSADLANILKRHPW